ncbi:MAG: ABC transporter permease subunit [Alphaproteobacteria bacterium]|nr:ABC transporter permease subunit [Alphaproteobacteria bacterium]
MSGLLRAVLLRAAAFLATVVGAAVIVQLLLWAAPGDPIDLLPNGDELRPVLEVEWGLDLPVPLRIARWLGHAARGDLGTSLSVRPGASVLELLGGSVGSSALLLLGAMVAGMGGGLALAALTARGRGLARAVVQVLSVPPVFLMAYLAVVGINATVWALVQAGHIAPPSWFALPAEPSAVRTALAVCVLAFGSGALGEIHVACEQELQRLRQAPFVTAARARGAPVAGLLFRNLAPSLLSLAAARLPLLLGGLVVLERVLLLDGAGSLLWQACTQRDAPLAMGIAVCAASLVAAGGLLADLLRLWIDPRLRRPA